MLKNPERLNLLFQSNQQLKMLLMKRNAEERCLQEGRQCLWPKDCVRRELEDLGLPGSVYRTTSDSI